MQTIKVRDNPIVTKLDTPEFKSIFTPEIDTLFALFEKYNYMSSELQEEQLGLDGSVYDYFFGYEDLKQNKIAFIGDTIKGDSFPILRYFRFYGQIAEHPDNHDKNTLRIINQKVSGLDLISGERIWSELKRILEGRFAGELIKTMVHVGVVKHCGLNHVNECIDEFSKLWERSGHLKLKGVTLLSGLLYDVEDVLKMKKRLKMSSLDKKLAIFIVRNRNIIPDLKPLLTYQKLVINSKTKFADVKESIQELLKYQGRESLLKEFSEWQVPRLPVPENHLRDKCKIPEGRTRGAVIDELTAYWIDNEFKPEVEELLAQVPEILSRLEEKKS